MSSVACILDASHEKEWQNFCELVSGTDIYFSAKYHQLCEINNEGEARLFAFSDGGNVFIYPFMLTKGSSHDSLKIKTAYGYTGPLSNSMNSEFLHCAWSEFENWSVRKGVKLEFVRFHPLFSNQKFAPSDMKVVLDRHTISLNLSGNREDLIGRYSSLHKRNLKKSQSYKFDFTDCSMNEFKALYFETMERNNASEFYFFNRDYFEWLNTNLIGNFRIFCVRLNNQAVAAAIFLFGPDYIHYHLGGSKIEFQNHRANNALMHNVALWAQENGRVKLHLGGGRTNSESDNLFRFKKTIGDTYEDFYIGERARNFS